MPKSVCCHTLSWIESIQASILNCAQLCFASYADKVVSQIQYLAKANRAGATISFQLPIKSSLFAKKKTIILQYNST